MNASTPNAPLAPTALDATRLGDISPETLLAHILATMPGGVFTVDRLGHITSWNWAMEQLTGYRAEEVLGRSCQTLEGDTCCMGPVADDEHRCPLFASGDVAGKPCRIRHKEGHRLPTVKHARLMRGPDGEVLGGIESLTDVAEVLALEAEVQRLRRETGESPLRRLIGRHPTMRRLYDLIDVAAGSRASVLIHGETGTGKELVAHAIHHASERRRGPFVRVSCAALSESLLESELFGHVRGAFTGAVSTRKGRFEEADGGTLFLDEIGDISPDVQKKLLRVLQEHEFERVGDNRPIRVDIRVVTATHRDLRAMVEDGTFRADLYYRLAVFPILIPPLRARVSDLPHLVEALLERLDVPNDRHVVGIARAAMEGLMRYGWPGNVRELEHTLEFAAAVATGPLIEVADLPPCVRGVDPPGPAPLLGQRRSVTEPARSGDPACGGFAPETTRTHRRDTTLTPDSIRAALAIEGGVRARAARRLGVSRMTLWKWMQRFGVEA